MKEGEPTWCKNCERFFDESVSDHGRTFHQDEWWDVDYQKEPGA